MSSILKKTKLLMGKGKKVLNKRIFRNLTQKGIALAIDAKSIGEKKSDAWQGKGGLHEKGGPTNFISGGPCPRKLSSTGESLECLGGTISTEKRESVCRREQTSSPLGR